MIGVLIGLLTRSRALLTGVNFNSIVIADYGEAVFVDP
jgi:hypothetical protein